MGVPRYTPVWVIAVAAILTGLILFEAVGPVYGIALFVVAIAGYFAIRHYRERHPPEPPGIRCLKCGQFLPATARNCDFCGSASWTYRN